MGPWALKFENHCPRTGSLILIKLSHLDLRTISRYVILSSQSWIEETKDLKE